jgi:hypothetical protein
MGWKLGPCGRQAKGKKQYGIKSFQHKLLWLKIGNSSRNEEWIAEQDK